MTATAPIINNNAESAPTAKKKKAKHQEAIAKLH